MDLNSIKNPQDIKNYTKEELIDLASEIRTFLIEKLSVTGGHLGPNLGVVELTIALHKLFDSPKDKFIWDVGHQAYVHKILTGRADQFDTLRQYKGLCGFPKMIESEHDVWETGHSSTSLSAAMGMAAARDLMGTDDKVIPIIGDGALTGGMALEALNHIGHEQTDMIVILNDNEMSIAPNVGALHSVLGRLRTAGKYKKAKEELEGLLMKIPAFGGKIAATAEKLKDTLKYMLVSGIFFEELGFTYLGPVNGHDMDDLIETLSYAKKTKGPVIVHVLTKKGKGFKSAENDEIGTWHGVGPYKIESGEQVKPKAAAPGYSKTVSDTLIKIAKTNEKIAVITPAMTVGSKLEGFGKEFPKRLFDVGIAEQHATTMAGGMATQGMKPVLSIYSTFLQRGYDQVVHDICRQNLNVFFAIDRAGLVGADGETHQGVFDVAFLRHIPNMVVMMPKDENECQHMVYTASQYNEGPIAVRYPRGNGIGIPMDDQLKEIPIGSWEVIEEGTDIAILTFSQNMIQMALKAHEKLKQVGISANIVNARFIKPLDEAMLTDIAKAKMPIITLEEAALQGGFGSSVLEFMQENGFYDTVVDRMGIPDRFIEHGSVNQLLEEIGLTSNDLVERAEKLLPKKRQRA
ncbi:1-deoxy-D-xylulose-5-phosphate synthase [Lottiidibacillus patelloidae]|uniref:1-deoxy-D-xylulose-5-phosphate synthase n=1 Tax=Lottiidibacillus patelloidae TaxID=2670334 RepID=A0A263BV78_9BACI|nr:1-deoxy-D-xylulose-5-phosphate synthase [Lottiidibacillus patelloidae]OZM57619.1 1-deoxy-D-xylulose-5-phosphate synthase [Lottiidibacillus patelloidae]